MWDILVFVVTDNIKCYFHRVPSWYCQSRRASRCYGIQHNPSQFLGSSRTFILKFAAKGNQMVKRMSRWPSGITTHKSISMSWCCFQTSNNMLVINHILRYSFLLKCIPSCYLERTCDRIYICPLKSVKFRGNLSSTSPDMPLACDCVYRLCKT